jgi:superfamily II DNA/RNA helicase
MSFKEIGLSEKVLAAVEASGYTEPTPIQAQAIPHALTGRDILGIAQTGTGKTAAFVLPMLCRLEQGRARARMPRTLILEPTRELAAQVEEAFLKYGAQHKLNVALLIGGMAFGDQETKIMRGADVLIATPGRLLDFYERGKLLLTGIEILVIDEADRMLDMGFIPDIEKICKLVPFTRQTLFFSATMPPEITRLTEQFLQNPLRVEVARVGSTAVNITQGLVASHGSHQKRETLRQLIRGAENFRNAIIFCNRKRDVAILHKSLQKHGFSAGALHGDMDQPARMASLDAFKSGEVSLIVCSDVAARGLDIPDVSHVFNFDLPIHPDDYVHRIGRTGRAGKFGVAISIITPEDTRHLDAILKLINKPIEWIGPGLNALGEPTVDERSRGRNERPRRGERRDRGERGERSARPARGERPQRGAPRPVAADSEQPVIDDAAFAVLPQENRQESQEERPRSNSRERPDRDRRNSRPVAAEAPVPVAPQRDEQPRLRQPQPQSRSEGQRRYRDHDDGPPVVGMGDHMPAFMMRQVVIKRTPKPAAKLEPAAATEE